MRTTRIVLTLYGVLFGLLGVGFLAAPDLLAHGFQIEALSDIGLANLRADMGGAFLLLSGLCLYGVWGQRRGPLIAALALLSVIVVARVFGVAATGSLAGLKVSLPVELGAIVALALHLRWHRPWTEGGPKMIVVAGMGAVALALAGGLVAISLVPAVQDRMFERGAVQLLTPRNSGLLKDDALRVAICGSSSPLPSDKRAKACVAVIAGGKIYIVDVGPESVENIAQWGVPMDKIDAVLLSHFHSDHIGDLGELNLQTWVQGRPGPLAVYGGPGVERVVAGFAEAYSQDQTYRTAHHGTAIANPATWPMQAHPVVLPGPDTPQKSRKGVVLKDGALTITAIEINHAPVTPAYAYRFDYKGRSVVITGDGVAHPPLVAASKGVDLFVSEALSRPMVKTLEGVGRKVGRDRVSRIMADIQSYHGGPTEMADIANQAGARMLVLYHLIPAPDNPLMRRVFVRGLDQARKGAPWHMADDNSLYTLPLGSDEIRVGKVPE